jgi:MFS family permease
MEEKMAPIKTEPPKAYRWLVLVIISLAMFGNYYAYDCIAPLADVLKSQLGFSDKIIGLLNGIYSFPNIIMVLVGGVIIDRIGTRKGTLLFGSFCLAGAALTAATPNAWVMICGRLLFGLGAESLIVAVTTALAKWFRGKELSFAFGINLLIARMGSFAAQMSPTWASSAYDKWQWPLFIGVAFATFCITGPVLYILLERRAESHYALAKESEPDKVIWRDLFKMSPSFWYMVALCVTFYSAIFPFQTFAVKFFMEAHGATRESGGQLLAMLTLFAMIATPLFGLLVDKVAKRSLFMMFGSLLLVPVYLMMGYSSVSLFIPMAMMGVAYSLIPAIMWPSVAYIVEQKKLGTAYGLMTAIQNVGLFGFNVLVGWANDTWNASAANPSGYHAGMWIFSCLGFFGLLFAFLLRRAERGPHAHGLETITTKSASVEGVAREAER